MGAVSWHHRGPPGHPAAAAICSCPGQPRSQQAGGEGSTPWPHRAPGVAQQGGGTGHPWGIVSSTLQGRPRRPPARITRSRGSPRAPVRPGLSRADFRLPIWLPPLCSPAPYGSCCSLLSLEGSPAPGSSGCVLLGCAVSRHRRGLGWPSRAVGTEGGQGRRKLGSISSSGTRPVSPAACGPPKPSLLSVQGTAEPCPGVVRLEKHRPTPGEHPGKDRSLFPARCPPRGWWSPQQPGTACPIHPSLRASQGPSEHWQPHKDIAVSKRSDFGTSSPVSPRANCCQVLICDPAGSWFLLFSLL